MNKPSDTDIDTKIKGYFTSLRLDDSTAARLVELQEMATKSVSGTDTSRRHFLLAASVSGVFIATSAGYSAYQWRKDRDRSQLSSDVQLITELVTNHRNRVPLDVQSESIDRIARTLTDVPFTLKLPENLLADAKLMGGRYCSLLGEPAIQVRLVDTKSRRDITAFVAHASKTLVHFDGVETATEDLVIAANRMEELMVTVVKER